MKDKLIKAIREVPIADKTYPEYIEAIADKLIAEGVIVPPLWAGQTVYSYNLCFGVVLAYLIDNVYIGSLGKSGVYWAFEANCHDEETDEFLDELDFDLDYIGKTVFLTREEAEQALKGANDER